MVLGDNPNEIMAQCKEMVYQTHALMRAAHELAHRAYGLASVAEGRIGTDQLAQECYEQLQSIEKFGERCMKKEQEIMEYVEEMYRFIPPTADFL